MTIGRFTRLLKPSPEQQRDAQLRELRVQLLLHKKWSYLRYLHLREGLIACDGVQTVLAVGAGRGLAEVALAVEFPEIHFQITDVESSRTPNYQAAQSFARKWGLPNVGFGILDVSQPIPDRYDLIASTEVLEHIEDDEQAIEHMLDAANRYVYCLVPFADEQTLADPRKQAKAWERHEHYRFGYSAQRFQQIFEDIAVMRGCYWREHGFAHRQEINDLGDRELRSRVDDLTRGATHDVVDALPESPDEAQGIWVLARSKASTKVSPPERTTTPRKSNELDTPEGRLREVRKRLVFYRSWSYFRYLHLRQGFLATEDVESVLSIGSGRGLAELALAIEFPEVRFHLTDIDSPHTSSARQVSELAEHWGIGNLTIGRQDILETVERRYDLVCSTEVLEHIEDDERAAANMRAATRRYVFCLVPFADAATNADPVRRERAWQKDRHYRFGYSAEDLRRLFPGPSIVRGCYWQDGGAVVMSSLKDLEDAELVERAGQIAEQAEVDVRDAIPSRYPEALGIWILSALPEPSAG